MKWIVIAATVLCVPLWSFAGDTKTIKREIRDSSGKLLYKNYTRGNITETRDASGKLVIKSKTTNGKTEVRSPTGKLLYKVK